MSTYRNTGSHVDSRSEQSVPAYGPIDAALGYVLFYVVVGRATPTVVAVTTDAVPDVSPSLVELGLAAALWFVLAVTVLEQARRQLAALGIGTRNGDDFDLVARLLPAERRPLAYLVALLVGGVVAAWTFDRGVETAVSTIRVVATLDAAAFVPADFAVMVVFFVSFSVATHALDRLSIDAVRAMLTD